MKHLRLWNKLLQYFADMRLIQKFCLLFVLAWILPMIFSSYYVYQRITYNIIESQLELACQAQQQVKSFLDYRLERIYLTCRTIAMDSKINEILRQNDRLYTTVQQMRDLADLRVYLEQFQNAHNRPDIIRLYVSGGRIYSNENKLIFNLNAVEDTLWYRKAFRGWGWTTCNPPELMETQDVVSVVQPIRDFNNYRRKIGAVRIDIPLDEIQDMLERASINHGSLIYIVSNDGMLVAASSSKLLSLYRLNDKHLKQAVSANSKFISIWDEGRKLWVYASIIENGWLLVTVLPEKEIVSGISTIQLQYIIAVSLLFIVVILINVPAINSITKRVKQLVDRMKLVQEGNLSANLEFNNRDEIGQLAENFNYMLERIKDLMAQQYTLGQELKTAELKALQSQINPHFLYNTLEMIGWLALGGSPQEIRSVVRTMAQFYRLSLNRGDDITSIAKELELVKSYMYIQNIRFQNRIKLSIDVPSDIQMYSIPKITLQPIVENAIIHGILEKPSKIGSIQIKGQFTSDGMIELSVIDDGVGMDAEQLEKLRKGELLSSENTSYGINNIQKRICLLFGTDRGLSFQSQRNVGTKITLYIPPVKYSGNE